MHTTSHEHILPYKSSLETSYNSWDYFPSTSEFTPSFTLVNHTFYYLIQHDDLTIIVLETTILKHNLPTLVLDHHITTTHEINTGQYLEELDSEKLE